jgi:hypothetical protein
MSIFHPNQYHQTGLVPPNGTSTTKQDETSTVKGTGVVPSNGTLQKKHLKKILKKLKKRFCCG